MPGTLGRGHLTRHLAAPWPDGSAPQGHRAEVWHYVDIRIGPSRPTVCGDQGGRPPTKPRRHSRHRRLRGSIPKRSAPLRPSLGLVSGARAERHVWSFRDDRGPLCLGVLVMPATHPGPVGALRMPALHPWGAGPLLLDEAQEPQTKLGPITADLFRPLWPKQHSES